MSQQSKAMSLLESTLNNLAGMALAWGVQVLVFPLYGIKTDVWTDIQLVGIFTCVSIARSYIFRRIFNRVG